MKFCQSHHFALCVPPYRYVGNRVSKIRLIIRVGIIIFRGRVVLIAVPRYCRYEPARNPDTIAAVGTVNSTRPH